jgi:hypothetical protein
MNGGNCVTERSEVTGRLSPWVMAAPKRSEVIA